MGKPLSLPIKAHQSYVNIANYVEIHINEKPNGRTTNKETLKWVHIAVGNAKRDFVGT